MPELDRRPSTGGSVAGGSAFDDRLERLVHAYADAARTPVDAVAVADRAMRGRRLGRLDLITATVPVPVPIVALAVVLVLLGGWSLTGGLPWPAPWGVAGPGVTTPSPSSPSPSPSPTVAPTTPAFVSGSGIVSQQSAGTTTADRSGTSHTTGIALQLQATMNDPRVTGTGTYVLAVDGVGSLGFASGTLRLAGPDGAWQGSCSGAVWDRLAAGTLSCWLAGEGAYAGMTFYLNVQLATSSSVSLSGTVLQAAPPSP